MYRKLTGQMFKYSMMLFIVLLVSGSACTGKKKVAVKEALKKPAAEHSVESPHEQQEYFVKDTNSEHFTIVYTSSVQGYVAPCGCTEEPLGGIARLATLIGEAKKAYGDRMIFLDAGNLLFEKKGDNLPADACQTKARHELLLKTYKNLGLEATVLGDRDLERTAAWRDELLSRHKIMSLDGYRKKKQQKSLKSKIIVRGKIKVAVIGLPFEKSFSAKEVHSLSLDLQKEIKESKEKGAQFIVVINQLPKEVLSKVVQKIHGLNLIINGYDPAFVPEAAKYVGKEHILMLASGIQGQYLGVVEVGLELGKKQQFLTLDESVAQNKKQFKVLNNRLNNFKEQLSARKDDAKYVAFMQGRIDKVLLKLKTLKSLEGKSEPVKAGKIRAGSITLSEKVPAQADVAKQLSVYEKAIPDLVSKCEAGIECVAAKPGEATYVGVEACYACHQSQVKFWQKQQIDKEVKNSEGVLEKVKIGHSKAWKTLVDVKKQSDRTCIGCHSIGFNEPGGYCKVSQIDFRKNVQCESCHGPASLHIQNGGDVGSLVIKKVTETTCRSCHQVPHIESYERFNFKERLHIILGEGHGLKRLQELDK